MAANQPAQAQANVKDALVLMQAARKMCKTVEDLDSECIRNFAEVALRTHYTMLGSSQAFISQAAKQIQNRNYQGLFHMVHSAVYLPLPVAGPAIVADEKKAEAVDSGSVLIYFAKNGTVVGQSTIPIGQVDSVCGGSFKKYYIIDESPMRHLTTRENFINVGFRHDIGAHVCGSEAFWGRMMIDSEFDL